MATAKLTAIDDTLATSDYWPISMRPLVCLLFIAPMLVLYECGVLGGAGASRNGADVWLRAFLEWIGVGQYFLLPILVCGVLLAWHYLRRDPWTMQRDVLGWMLVESLVLSWLLLLIAQVQGRVFAELSAAIPQEITVATSSAPSLFGRMISYLGAGIYEELLFRLMLLPVVIGAVRACGFAPRPSVIAGVIVVSLIFSAAHYRLDLELGPWHLRTSYGDVWSLYTFTFRFLAGVFFAALFQLRGFGIAAGSHAFYDIATAFC
ncbi:MAG TPA: CPBP family intramembrane glutamic endopeptidase [Pirellulaceae bacterium]|nr:CPBP family intramembrane glutamic endopeptidase [Pirellulaceae bacterium]